MRSAFLFFLAAILGVSSARLGPPSRGTGSHTIKHGMFPGTISKRSSRHDRRASIHRRQEPSGTGCGTGSQISTKAPKNNIFAGLTDDEAAAVTSFLHDQEKLNLTAAAEATSWDNKVVQVELLQPNKSSALAYLDSSSAAPDRYARVVIRFGATLEPYIQEYQVGPLPVTNGSTTLAQLDYIHNKGRGYQRLYDADQAELAAFAAEVAASIADITKSLLNGTAVGALNDSLAVAGSTPLTHEDGRIFQWAQFYSLHTGVCFDEDILPSGLMFKADITGRDPAKWSVVGWQYNGVFYKSEAAFRQAFNSSSFVRPGPNVDGDWACTDYNEDPFPHDEINPPVPIQPDGSRFAVDEQEKYVEWMDFSFYLSNTRDMGMHLHEIRYKGERIIYELGLQEAVAHYASASDPFQASNAYLDSEDGFGQFQFQLVSGFDCPTYATYLNTSFYTGETTHTHPSSICLFEMDTGYPIQRHTAPTYVSITKNIAFVVRTVATVGNYDYMFSYEFYMDGSIHVDVRASGYIQASFWTSNMGSQDGFHIHDNLAGAMHEHVLNYKVDLDVAGTANSVMKSALVPTTEVYPWSNGKPINTMTLERTFIASEDDGKLNWDSNNAVMYSVVNKDPPNKYGEYKGWKIMPGKPPPSSHYTNPSKLTILFLAFIRHRKQKSPRNANSSSLGQSVNWATHHLYAVQRKDSEPKSAHPYNGWDPDEPVIDFAKFFDGDSLDQVDVVVYFNLGMHHIPDTSDLPNTVFTSAHSSMILAPQNYLPGDPSRGTIHQTRINSINGSVTEVTKFGTDSSSGTGNEGGNGAGTGNGKGNANGYCNPDLTTWVGEVYIAKYPYLPDAQLVGSIGAGVEAGIP